MKKMLRLMILMLGIVSMAPAQSGGPIDLVVLLDTSASMSASYRATSDYLTGPFLKEFLRIGDTFHLISFAPSPKLEISRRVEGVGDVETIIGRILLMYPLNPSSDLSGALNFAGNYASSMPSERRKKIVLISDGDGNSASAQTMITEASSRLTRQGTEFQYIKVPITGTPSSGRPPIAARPSEPAKPSGAAGTQERSPARPPASGAAPQAQVPASDSRPSGGAQGQSSQPSSQGQSSQPPSPVQSGRGSPGQTQGGQMPNQTQPPGQPQSGQAPQTPSQTQIPSQTQGGQSQAQVPADTFAGQTPLTPDGQSRPAETGQTQGAQGPAPASQGASGSGETPPQAAPASEAPAASAAQETPPSGSGESQQIREQPSTVPPGQTAREESSRQPARAEASPTGGISGGLSLPLIIGLGIGGLLLLGLIIFLAVRNLHGSPNRAMAQAASAGSRKRSEEERENQERGAEMMSAFAAANRKISGTPPLSHPPPKPKPMPKDKPDNQSFENGPPMLSLFVEDQNTAIGRRNIHALKAGYTFSVGGGKSDFLIFLVPMPPHIADVQFDGRQCTFIPRKPQYFPDIGSQQVPNCIGKTIRVISDRHYELHIRMERYEDPLRALNKLLHSITVPGEIK